jgi:hypothetical protein
MAIRHGLAGQFGKIKATKSSKRFIGALIAAGAIIFIGVGFVWGYFWSQFGQWIALIAVVGFFGVCLLAMRRIDPYIQKMARERVKYLRGGQGEAVIAWVLQDQTEDDWHVFNGIKLEKDSDIDHVLVGPGGVFVISTKSQRGLFAGTTHGLTHNGKPCPFATDALHQTLRLKDRLAALMGNDLPWLQPILALPFGYTEGDACGGKVWLVHQWDIADRLAPEDGPKKLNKQQVGRVVKVLEMIQEGAAGVYQRPTAAVES